MVIPIISGNNISINGLKNRSNKNYQTARTYNNPSFGVTSLELLSGQTEACAKALEQIYSAKFISRKKRVIQMQELFYSFYNDLNYILFKQDPSLAIGFRESVGEDFLSKMSPFFLPLKKGFLLPSKFLPSKNSRAENALLAEYPGKNYCKCLQERGKDVIGLVRRYVEANSPLTA